MTRRKEFIQIKLTKVLARVFDVHLEVVGRAHERDFTWRSWSKKDKDFFGSLIKELKGIEESVIQVKKLRCL